MLHRDNDFNGYIIPRTCLNSNVDYYQIKGVKKAKKYHYEQAFADYFSTVYQNEKTINQKKQENLKRITTFLDVIWILSTLIGERALRYL